ncbi:MAG: T9SS C-terminal target domain-containing protein [Calditrichaeota bacterium]|nr:MAG: T9SS C-terminal target domain-containing protein [Calditrichota bacterium]
MRQPNQEENIMMTRILLISVSVFLFMIPLYADSPQRSLSLHRCSGTTESADNNIKATKTDNVSQSPGVSIVQGVTYPNKDYQSNGGDERHLWVLPDGTVHAVYFGNDWRQTKLIGLGSFYAFSSDNGKTFTRPVRVESVLANFPSMDITSDGRAVIVSQEWLDEDEYSGFTLINVDSSAGAGHFAQVDAPELPFECIWPRIAVPSDTHFVFWGSDYWENWSERYENSWNTYNPVTKTFAFPENQIPFPGVKGESSGTIARSAGGKVAIVLFNFGYCIDEWYGSWTTDYLDYDFGEGNIIMRESVDGGISFGPPMSITNWMLEPTGTIHVCQTGISALYVGEDLHLVWVETTLQPELYWNFEDLKIVHWSKNNNDGIPTTAVRWDSLHFGKAKGAGGYQGSGFRSGKDHDPICNPSIGMDENGILTIAFTGFSGDATNADPVTGFAYGDIWAVSSADSGLTWGEPINLTSTPDRDDRYPYMSTWNEAGMMNVLYMTDTRAGTWWDDNMQEKSRGNIDFMFLKTDHPSTVPYNFYPEVATEEHNSLTPSRCSLRQNYPNPFNPATTIEFSLLKKDFVALEVLNALGQTVAIVVSEVLAAGNHSYMWHAGEFPSGLYFYRLQTADFSQTRKMLLVR